MKSPPHTFLPSQFLCRLRKISSHFSFYLLTFAAIIAGVILRLYQISDQIIADDEWHAVYAASHRGYAYILTHFGDADYCIPLTFFYKLVLQTVGLSELVMRAPVLLAGIASLFVFPLLMRDWVGTRVACIFAWLLAISPLHIYFCRYARPYAISLFWVFMAWAAFYKWWIEKKDPWKVIYAVCAVAAGYFHLMFLPTALAPLLYGFADLIAEHAKGEKTDFARFLRLPRWVEVMFFLLLGLPLLTSARSLLSKVGRDRMDWDSITGAVELIIGSGNGWLVCVVLVGVLVGAYALFRQHRTIFRYLMVVGGIQLVAILVSRPNDVRMPIVVARYCFALLPIVLLCSAKGISVAEDFIRSRWTRYPCGVLSSAFVVMLLLLGPLRSIYYYPNAWTNHALFQYSYGFNPHVRYDLLRPAIMPRFYDTLRQSPPGRLLIIEAPWRYEWPNNSYPFYQAYHRQRMKVGFVLESGGVSEPGELRLGEPGNDFINCIHVGDERRLVELGVDYVVFHKNLRSQLPKWSGSAVFIDPSLWIERYRQHYGSPIFEDSEVVVFKLKEARPEE